MYFCNTKRRCSNFLLTHVDRWSDKDNSKMSIGKLVLVLFRILVNYSWMLLIIDNLHIFPLWNCQCKRTDSDTENYWSVWRQIHFDVTDINNSVSFEDLYILYHLYDSSSYQTWCDTSNDFCLTLIAAVILYLSLNLEGKYR